MRLNDSTMLHDQATDEVIEMVRHGQHVYIDWKTNLQHIMKRQYLQNDRCDFSLSTNENTCHSCVNNERVSLDINVFVFR